MAHYIDSDGLVTIARNPGKNSTGNGLLHLGLYLCELQEYGWLRRQDLDKFLFTLFLCSVKKEGRPLPLLWRSPGKNNPDDYETQDDYIGVLAALGLTKGEAWWAELFCALGRSWLWCFNSQEPGKFNFRFWHWRFPGLIAHYKAATREGPSPIGWAAIALRILWGALFEISRSDRNIHVYCFIANSKNKSLLCRFMGKFWYWRVRRRYGSVGLGFNEYFRDPFHPLCELP